MNYEYSEDELRSYDKSTLLKISRDYGLPTAKNDNKLTIISKIIDYQDDLVRPSHRNILSKFVPFNSLPADIHRLLALYMDICDIVHLCRLNKRTNNNICQNRILLRDLGHQRLTNIDERLANKDILKEINNTMSTLRAAEKGYLVALANLQNKGRFYIDAGDYDTLWIAAKNGWLDIVEYLISMGANVHAQDDRALREASGKGHLPIVKYLLSRGADIHVWYEEPLRNAAINGHLAAVKYLIDHGADIHYETGRLVKFAILGGHLDTIGYLLDLLSKDNAYLDWALVEAVEAGDLNVVKYLISRGADIHGFFERSLIRAIYRGDPPIIKYLLSQGADIHANNDEALRAARDSGHRGILKFLKNYDK